MNNILIQLFTYLIYLKKILRDFFFKYICKQIVIIYKINMLKNINITLQYYVNLLTGKKMLSNENDKYLVHVYDINGNHYNIYNGDINLFKNAKRNDNSIKTKTVTFYSGEENYPVDYNFRNILSEYYRHLIPESETKLSNILKIMGHNITHIEIQENPLLPSKRKEIDSVNINDIICDY